MDVNDFEFMWGMRSKQVQPRGIRQFKSGMVGIAKGQTARLNVVNTAEAGDLPFVTVYCGFTQNPRSEPLVNCTAKLEPGASEFLDLNRDTIAGHGETRLQIRAEVTVINDLTSACVITLEVFDSESGKSTVSMQVPEAR